MCMDLHLHILLYKFLFQFITQYVIKNRSSEPRHNNESSARPHGTDTICLRRIVIVVAAQPPINENISKFVVGEGKTI